MGEGYNFKQLRAEILLRSSSTDWEVAKKEWSLREVYDVDEPETCLCGHFPIIEICTIKNRINNESTEVGNVCVKRFLGIRSDLIFNSIKRIRADITKSLNADAIAFFYERRLLSEKERDFLAANHRRRNLTVAQAQWREDINRKVLDALARRGFRGPD